MQKLKRVTMFFLSAILWTSCQQQPLSELGPSAAAGEEIKLETVSDVANLSAEPDRGLSKIRKSGNLVILPSGSSNGLATAIETAGDGGVVLLQSGSHTQSGTTIIQQRVTIVGEPGAQLIFDVAAVPPTANFELVSVPGLHIKDSRRVTIWGIEFVTATTTGNTVILVENSEKTVIAHNRMTNYQFGVIIEKSPQTIVYQNTIIASNAWLTGALPETHGVMLINGAKCAVVNNDISGALLGAFMSDRNGNFTNNSLSGNFFGMLLCNVPQYIMLPGGSVSGSLVPATRWQLKNNHAAGNFDIGFLVIDGANNNVIRANTGENNGRYDLELAGDSQRFGFLTPTSYANKVDASNQPSLIIKDCGVDNQVVGGTLVDNQQDPCN